jgi:hypothetical protein
MRSKLVKTVAVIITLVEMRQGLEKSYEEFKEKLGAFQKQN